MTVKIYNKLVRDNVVNQARARGLTVAFHIIEDDTQYLAALADKLVEEAEELADSLSVEELADVLEVVMAIAEELASMDLLEDTRQLKARIRGSFARRIYLESIEDDE